MNESQEYERLLLADPNIYIPRPEWFHLLQDPGKEMSEKEKAEWLNNPRKKKTRNTSHGQSFHPDIYLLATKVFKLFLEHKK